jgi:signal transduction histidine kinase
MSETEKLAGIGQFAAGIAHQLNTPLGSILLSAQMLEESVSSDDDTEDVQRIIRQTEQCRLIIKGLLNFARPSGGERGRLDLADVVRDTVFLMEKPLRVQNVEVTVDARDRGTITGNRNEIEQVVFNLLANSLDALSGGGKVDILIQAGDPGEVEMVFADDGEGVPEEFRDDVFLPFFTTKEYGKGTGLGLSIVARIIHEHGGRIELARSEGARFHMAFPAHRPGAAMTDAVLIEGDEAEAGREE